MMIILSIKNFKKIKKSEKNVVFSCFFVQHAFDKTNYAYKSDFVIFTTSQHFSFMPCILTFCIREGTQNTKIKIEYVKFIRNSFENIK